MQEMLLVWNCAHALLLLYLQYVGMKDIETTFQSWVEGYKVVTWVSESRDRSVVYFSIDYTS